MLNKVQIRDKSIESAGFKKDYKAAIAEYIWNGFEANATSIEIISYANSLGGLDYIEIIDNGEGIIHDNLDNTFGSFLFSQKTLFRDGANSISNKGKGRYSFISFASQAKWETVYKQEDKYFSYNIIINAGKKDYYDASEKMENNSGTRKTGTKLTISGISELTNESIESDVFKRVLLNIFAWFLYLNKAKDYKIKVNGMKLNYEVLIDPILSENREFEIDNYKFAVFFIKWNDDIKHKYFYYFMNEQNQEVHKKHTSFNNNAIDFFHSVYISSDYFNCFEYLNLEYSGQTILGEPKHENDETFKKLLKKLNKFISDKRKAYVKTEVPKVIQKFEDEGAFPKFSENKYDQERKQDLVTVVKELYCIQPKIFHKLNAEQKKSILGFLNLLLSTDERENIILIIDNITNLSTEEREELSGVLKKTSLTKIVHTIKMIENRYTVIELLKKLVFDLGKFTSERYHIQKIIEESYWLFGEQYNLVSADENFEKALKEYEYLLDGKKLNKHECKIDNDDHMRRPDIFICRQRPLEYPNGSQYEENIIVELKEPSVVLNKDVYRQIEDYMDLIHNEAKFNSQHRKWKFIAVCCKVDDFIRGLYSTFQKSNKLFLVHQRDNFEIYAMTWDDVFKSFDIRHEYIYRKLNFDKAAIEEELALKGIKFSRDSANDIRDKILSVQMN